MGGANAINAHYKYHHQDLRGFLDTNVSSGGIHNWDIRDSHECGVSGCVLDWGAGGFLGPIGPLVVALYVSMYVSL